MKRRAKILLLIGLIFTCGFVAGIFVARRAVIHKLQNFKESDTDKLRTVFMKHFSRQLKLDDQQKARVSEIVIRHHAEMRALRRENAPRLKAIIDSACDEMAPLLDERQKDRLESMRIKAKKRWTMP